MSATPARAARITPRQQMIALGLAGLALTAVVIQTAFTSLSAVERTRHTGERIREAERLHQDADMLHDALHADVLDALLNASGQGPDTEAEFIAELDRDTNSFVRDLDGLRNLVLPEEIASTLDRVRKPEDDYIASAKSLATLAFVDRNAAVARLEPFEQSFRGVERDLGRVTAQLAQAAEQADAAADRQESRARTRIVAASTAALVGLVAMCLLLDALVRRLAETVAQLHVQVEAVKRSDERSREFLAYAAHQLRTPISAARASVEALLMKGARPEQEDLLTAAGRETHRAGRLVAALLRMARLDQGEVPDRRPCDVVGLCAAEVGRMESQAPSIAWDLTAAGDVPPGVMLSPDGVTEALANLLDNARRHAANRVRVEVSVGSGELKVAVCDDGPGLPPERVDEAFARFVSLDGKGGSGLGLPIARGLTEAQGGHLDYIDGGFVMAFPLDEAPVPVRA